MTVKLAEQGNYKSLTCFNSVQKCGLRLPFQPTIKQFFLIHDVISIVISQKIAIKCFLIKALQFFFERLSMYYANLKGAMSPGKKIIQSILLKKYNMNTQSTSTALKLKFSNYLKKLFICKHQCNKLHKKNCSRIKKIHKITQMLLFVKHLKCGFHTIRTWSFITN